MKNNVGQFYVQKSFPPHTSYVSCTVCWQDEVKSEVKVRYIHKYIGSLTLAILATKSLGHQKGLFGSSFFFLPSKDSATLINFTSR